MFAKLFENPQICALMKSGDKGPEIRLFFEPEGLGVCETAFQFSDTDDGWTVCQETFDQLTEEKCREQVAKVVKEFQKMELMNEKT